MFRTLIKTISLIGLFVLPISAQATLTTAQVKHTQKVERRLDQKEARLKKYFLSQRQKVNEKYEKRLHRLQKKQHRISKQRLERKKQHLLGWYQRELKQIDFQERNVFQKINQRRENISPSAS